MGSDETLFGPVNPLKSDAWLYQVPADERGRINELFETYKGEILRRANNPVEFTLDPMQPLEALAFRRAYETAMTLEGRMRDELTLVDERWGWAVQNNRKMHVQLLGLNTITWYDER